MLRSHSSLAWERPELPLQEPGTAMTLLRELSFGTSQSPTVCPPGVPAAFKEYACPPQGPDYQDPG